MTKFYERQDGTESNADSDDTKKNVYFGGMIPRNVLSVTPNDGADLTKFGTLYVTGAGTVKVDMVGSGQFTFTAVANTFYKLQVKRVYATGTSATGIYVLW